MDVADADREVEEDEHRYRPRPAAGIANSAGPRLHHPGHSDHRRNPRRVLEVQSEPGKGHCASGDGRPVGARAVFEADSIDAPSEDDRECQLHQRGQQSEIVDGRCDVVDEDLDRVPQPTLTLDRIVSCHPLIQNQRGELSLSHQMAQLNPVADRTGFGVVDIEVARVHRDDREECEAHDCWDHSAPAPAFPTGGSG